MIAKPHLPSRLIFDLDSTVLVVYGNNKAQKSVTPHQAGTTLLSSTALLRGRTKDSGMGSAPWKCSYCQRTLDLLKACFANPFGNQSVIIRADKGFYDRTIVEWLEECKARFVIVARLTRLSTQAGSPEIRLGQYRSATAEFYYQPLRWFHPTVRGYSTTSTRRVRATADVVQAREVPLSNPGYQSRSKPSTSGASTMVEQESNGLSESSREITFGQDPYPSLLCQRRLLSSIALGLQLSELVQAAVFAREFQAATLDTLRNRILLMPALLLRTGNRPRLAMPPVPTGKRLEACAA